jgi:hypothetical protein
MGGKMFKFENGQLNFKCPNCHTDEPILKTTAAGNDMLNVGDKVGSKHANFLLANDQKLRSGELAGRKAKVIWAHSDFCGKCGTEYVYLVELNEVEVPAPVHRSGEKKIILPNGLIPPPGRAS